MAAMKQDPTGGYAVVRGRYDGGFGLLRVTSATDNGVYGELEEARRAHDGAPATTIHRVYYASMKQVVCVVRDPGRGELLVARARGAGERFKIATQAAEAAYEEGRRPLLAARREACVAAEAAFNAELKVIKAVES